MNSSQELWHFSLTPAVALLICTCCHSPPPPPTTQRYYHHYYLANPSAKRRKLLSCAFLNVSGFFVRHLIFCSHPPFIPLFLQFHWYYLNNGEDHLVGSKDWGTKCSVSQWCLQTARHWMVLACLCSQIGCEQGQMYDLIGVVIHAV